MSRSICDLSPFIANYRELSSAQAVAAGAAALCMKGSDDSQHSPPVSLCDCVCVCVCVCGCACLSGRPIRSSSLCCILILISSHYASSTDVSQSVRPSIYRQSFHLSMPIHLYTGTLFFTVVRSLIQITNFRSSLIVYYL